MKYSAADIGRMRDAVRYLTMPPISCTFVGARVERIGESRIEHIIETRLLTYMANETTADELEALVEEHREKARHDAEARYKAEMEQSRIQFTRPLVLEPPQMLGREPSPVPHVSPSGVIKQKRRRWWRP